MYKVLKRERIIHTPKEVSDLIALIKKFGLKPIKIGRGAEFKTMNQYLATERSASLNGRMIIELKETKLEITTRYYDGKPCTYIFNLNGEESFACSGLRCFTEFSKAFKVPKATTYDYPKLSSWLDEEKGSYICSASPIIGFNPRFENKVIEDIWEYDLNSAYSSVLMNKMPDLYHPLWSKDQHVKKGFIGFYLNNHLSMVEAGGYADVTFPLIDSPESLKDYCMKWYDKKTKSTGSEKLYAKAMLNLPIGYTQRYNPFFRAYIVHSCNNQIIDLIDEDSLLWNTDAIISKRRRTDLKIGDKIGEFKEIHFKKIKYIGNTYQLDDELPTWRGVPKYWFKKFEQIHGRPFNIFEDPVPNLLNLYEWDWDTLKLRRNYE